MGRHVGTWVGQEANNRTVSIRFGMQFKANMVDDFCLIHDSNPGLQPFRASRVVEAASADSSSLKPITRVMPRSPSPVEKFAEGEARTLRCARCFKLCARLSEGTIRTCAETLFVCAAVGQVCVRVAKHRVQKARRSTHCACSCIKIVSATDVSDSS